MKRFVIHITHEFILMLLILLWAYAALSKLSTFTTFEMQLSKQPLPTWSIHILVWTLPATELLTAVLIYCRRTRLKGLIISSILMLSFTMYVLFALSGTFGEIPCSCAGLIAAPGWKGHLVFNIVFTVVGLTGIFLSRATGKSFTQR